jgi:hypothetical protein
VLIRKGNAVFSVFSALKISGNEKGNAERENHYNSLKPGRT